MEAPKPWDASFLLTMERNPSRTPAGKRRDTACLDLESKFGGNFAAPVWRSAIIEHPEASETEERLMLLMHTCILSLLVSVHCPPLTGIPFVHPRGGSSITSLK